MKTLLIIADKPHWAYHNIAKCWEELLRAEYEVYVAFSEDYQIDARESSTFKRLALNTLNTFRTKDKRYFIHPSGKYSYPVYRKKPVYRVQDFQQVETTHFDCIIELAYYFQYTAEFPFTCSKRLVGLYTDCFPHEGPRLDKKNNRDLSQLSREEFFRLYLQCYDGLVVGNMNLYEDYQPFTNRIVFANGIYRQDEFKENPAVGQKDTFTLAWTGNPERPMKGFKEVILPAIELVEKSGRTINLKTRFSGDYEGLLDFYNDVDLVVIASDADTGPSLFSEAALSRVPCISTRIGFPKMVIQHNENGVFIERNIQQMVNEILRLYDNKVILQKFSNRIKEDYLLKLDNRISIANLRNFLKTIE